MGNTRTRQQNGDFHLGDFHDDFRCQPASGIENLVVTGKVLQPHGAGNSVGGIVPPDIFDKHSDVGAMTQAAAVHGAGALVDFIVGADIFQ